MPNHYRQITGHCAYWMQPYFAHIAKYQSLFHETVYFVRSYVQLGTPDKEMVQLPLKVL